MRLRHVADLVRGSGFPHEYQGERDGDLPFFKVADLSAGDAAQPLTDCENWVTRTTAAQLRARPVPSGTTLLPKIGAAMMLPTRRATGREAVFDNNVLGIVPRRIEPRYLRYWLLTVNLVELANPGPVPSLDDDALRDLLVPVEERGEQNRIADFLDVETVRIDTLIKKKQRMIELAQERWFQTCRTNLCERGGARRIPWLPPIPNRWDVLPLRRLVTCLDGQRVPLNAEERSSKQGEIPYWGANGVVDHVDEALFNEPLVLLGEDGAPFFDRSKPVAFVANEPVWVNNHIHVLRPSRVSPEFLMHYLNVVDYSAFITGTTRDKLTQRDMGQIPVPSPSEDEQAAIVAKLETASRKNGRLLDALSRQIGLLSAHRQALITAAVAGERALVEAA